MGMLNIWESEVSLIDNRDLIGFVSLVTMLLFFLFVTKFNIIILINTGKDVFPFYTCHEKQESKFSHLS